MDVVPAVRQKVARNLGEGKAKREAAVDKVMISTCSLYFPLYNTLHFTLLFTLHSVFQWVFYSVLRLSSILLGTYLGHLCVRVD